MNRLIFLCLLLPAVACTQPGNWVFNDTVLHRIEVTIDLPNWLDTLSLDYKLNAAYPDSIAEQYRLCTVTFDGVVVPNSGIRQRGNFSNAVISGKKKPFKIAFDAVEEQRFDGLKKINLNNFTSDPTLLHESLGYLLYRESGVPAPRTSYAELFVNNEYWGLYLLTENVDKTFLKRHFGNNNDGNLYKTDRQSGVTLQWLGEDQETYKAGGLKLTTNEEADDWSGLIDFVRTLNFTSDDSMEVVLPQIFHLPGYLQVLAIEKLIQNWDSYWNNGNNFYLYEHPDGKIYWIPWDINESFQGLRTTRYSNILDGYLVPTKAFDKRPLLKKIFLSEQYQQAYFDTVCQLVHDRYSVAFFQEKAIQWRALIAESYRNDPNKINSFEDFSNSLTDWHTDELGLGKSSYAFRFRYRGLFDFIRRQQAWAIDQMRCWDYDCDPLPEWGIQTLNVFPNPSEGPVTIHNSRTMYAQVRFVNMQGRLAQVGPYTWYAGDIPVQVSSLPQGVYQIQVIAADGWVGIGKMVKI